MYRVGELWEVDEISVAREHMATAITESLLSATYPYLFSGEHTEKKTIISCTANEYHQLGGKMVADIFELNGWDAHSLGANTPTADLISLIEEIKPDLVGLTLAVHYNLPSLKTTLEAIRGNYQNLEILVGGHAFAYGGTDILKKISGTSYLESLSQLEDSL
jgi:methanogenic corrinoid protein MtbC1